eukprot:CAMPEP_0119376818 /NCGR_PEP_ID=MMETSP1334-20130426/41438_1 /TAXON_ID=127549 /ORGANISM="Calcidiscus leptoporus, Strain RCC1130" /LENGTH=78 /DNA_ID=CAMNT_0007395499 /DNA_START=257 /DNA_END=493 /DNA_ORIENTATION=-
MTCPCDPSCVCRVLRAVSRTMAAPASRGRRGPTSCPPPSRNLAQPRAQKQQRAFAARSSADAPRSLALPAHRVADQSS